MTIDMPLWAQDKKGENSPFHLCSSEQLIAMTDQNLRLIDAFGPAHVKWLNVTLSYHVLIDHELQKLLNLEDVGVPASNDRRACHRSRVFDELVYVAPA